MTKWLFLSFCVGISMVTLASAIVADFDKYLAESQCVRKHTAIGIERNNIVTENGTCRLKKN